MKTKVFVLAFLTIFCMNESRIYAQSPNTDKKVLIVYYSLRNGNTRIVAYYRPPLQTKVPNFEQYDTIYLGSPNWWNTIAN
jgi:hypothetical protein